MSDEKTTNVTKNRPRQLRFFECDRGFVLREDVSEFPHGVTGKVFAFDHIGDVAQWLKDHYG